MTDDAALFAAALAHPDQDTPRLVLSDWYDDHDEIELAWALRSVPGIIPFLADLVRWDRMPATQTQEFKDGQWVNRWESQYWAELLVRYLDQFPQPSDVTPNYDPDAGWVSPSSPVRVGSGAFLADWQAGRRWEIQQLRENAARTASGWRGQFRVTLPEGDDPRVVEERAVLLHELTFHGCRPQDIPGGEDAWAECVGRGHPLFRLPPYLLAVDSGVQSLSGWVPRDYVYDPLRIWSRQRPLPHRGQVLLSPAGSREPEPDGLAWAAVWGWRDNPNGRLEGREFTLPEPFSEREEWDGWFESLPLESVARVNDSRCRVGRLQAEEAYRNLFLAARFADVAGHAVGSAYARLHAWESLSWLVGAGGDQTCEQIAESAERCRWFAYDTDWFLRTLWDVALVCVRPNGRSLAVLAATGVYTD
jgi:uncharacterized protein (TIGR02996 family)